MTVTSPQARDVSRPEFIALIAGLMALNAMAIDIMLPALPYMGEALGVLTENDRHYVLTAYMIGFGLAQIAFGPLSDRFGRKIPLVIGMSIYVIAAFAAAFSPNFTTLLVLRMIQGMGAASTRVISTSLVRDRFGGRAMAEVMSLVFMVFMIVPVIAPALGQVLLLTGPWEYIFFFMAGLGFIITVWTWTRLPETLAPENRRALRPAIIIESFRLVFSNRMAFSYGLSAMFVFGALFGFISTAQQIYVDIYDLGALFPLAFALIASLMAVSSYTNSRIVRRIGMRRLSHGAMLVFTAMSGLWFLVSLTGFMPLWLFFCFLAVIMFMFGWIMANINSLAMEPLGKVAGTASAVFGLIQTVGGALMGTIIGQFFNGTIVPIAAGYFVLGALALGCILVAEKGKLFGVGEEYRDESPAALAGH
ncbi:multidrug effflux MFS transporter [Pelagibacterium montanilacus]|uniref:multidrug effflux MFS transporter n=1 Tax=Pelagibacterium montanilacus TaxID=2185280 RepID=UPI000F8CA746|nr:multidrug effflux MFS transporter [Pelagibacterium montanilacus]